jgi:DNA-binding response OmpR family regulator
MPPRILVIEDEPGIRLALKDELLFEGFDVELAEDGPSGLAAILRSTPALIVLDLMLPGRNGFEICQEVRTRGIRTSIIVLTARNQEVDKVRGLGLGADDYVTKPFSLAELVARIRAVLRRVQTEGDRDVLEAPPIKVDLRRHRAYKGDIELQLTDTEFRILTLLLRRCGEVITRDDFLKQIWGEQVYVTHRTVDTHVAALRKKIENDSEHPAYILSVRNVGYRLNENLTPSSHENVTPP